MKLMPDNWQEIFIPELSLAELVVRGMILYFLILILLRILPRRTISELGAMDLVFVLLITEAASHALGDFTSIGDGVIMVMVIMICSFSVNQLTFHSTFFQKMFEQPPVPIIKDGKMLHRNIRKELITQDELMARLHENGIEDLKEVKDAWVESEGNISMIKWEKNED